MSTVVVADPSAFDRRFIRAAAVRCGADAVREAATVDELAACLDGLPVRAVVVVDPAIEDGSDVDVVDLLERSGANLIFFSSREAAVDAATALGFEAIRKRGVVYLEGLEQAITDALARRVSPASAVRAPAADEPPATSDEHLRLVVETWRAEIDRAEGAEPVDLRGAGSANP